MRLTWLYGYTDREGHAPATPGIDPRYPVRALGCGSLVAVVSDVPADDWTGPRAEARLADVEQVAPLAVRHLEIVQDVRRTVVPSPFATVFSSDDALVRRTTELAPALLDALERVRGRREWSVKGWVDAEPPAPSAPPTGSGAGWLRARRDQQRLVEDRRARIEAAADAAAELLQPLAVAAVQRAGAVPEPGAELAWNWAFLVDEACSDAFRSALESVPTPPGLRCAWSGPLPPYSFVAGDAGA